MDRGQLGNNCAYCIPKFLQEIVEDHKLFIKIFLCTNNKKTSIYHDIRRSRIQRNKLKRLKTYMKKTIKRCWKRLKETEKVEIWPVIVDGNMDCYLGVKLGDKCSPSLRGNCIKSVKEEQWVC